MTTIDPTTLLQVDASVIVGIFIFLTILEYTGRKPDSHIETKQKKEKFRFPSIVIFLFASSACTILLGIAPLSFILTFLGFAVIIFSFAYWFIKPDKNPILNLYCQNIKDIRKA
jgi:quinol-cytochrome oxidoreductase complex cytochrome b subunit